MAQKKRVTEYRTIYDNLGQIIVPGVKVVFNHSGHLALGVVVSANVTHSLAVTWGDGEVLYYDIRIRLVAPLTQSHDATHVAKVKNPRSVVVVSSFPGKYVE
jgi:hypothetical protein